MPRINLEKTSFFSGHSLTYAATAETGSRFSALGERGEQGEQHGRDRFIGN
jgi:hypothetical protein